jgi:ABC-type phosphate transport system substrate-binding protein
MLTRRQFVKAALGTVAGLSSGLGASIARAQGLDSLAIVVAKQSPIQTLTEFELKKLYLGTNITAPNGTRIIPFNQAPNSPDRVLFESRVLDMSPEQVAQYWIDRKIRGQGVPPKVVSPADLLQKVVSRLENSIAYVRISNVSADVRVIAIDGHLPGDGSYGLSV